MRRSSSTNPPLRKCNRRQLIETQGASRTARKRRYHAGAALGEASTIQPAHPCVSAVARMVESPLSPNLFHLTDYKDEYREGLQRIIDAKIAGAEIIAPAAETTPQVVNLMDALKKSLDAVSATKKRPAKAEVLQAVAKRRRA